MSAGGYTALVKRAGNRWIGWVQEVPGVNAQERTKEELLHSLREALCEAIEFNREDARRAAEPDYVEEPGAVKRRELIRHLMAEGCIRLRERSRHSWWHNPVRDWRSAVPRHSEIQDILARKICRDLEVREP